MNRYWQLLRALVLVRPVIAILLILFYVMAALLSVMLDTDKKGSGIAMLCAIPTCGFFAIATERCVQYSMANGLLGIPRHGESLRKAQIMLLVVLIGGPAIIGIAYGGQPGYMALLCVPAALGVLLALYARWAFAIWISVALATRFSYSINVAMPGLSNPWVRTLLIVASAAVLSWWLSIGKRTEKRVRGGVLLIADATQEWSSESTGESLGVDSAGFKNYERDMESRISGVIADMDHSGVTNRVLGVGLGIDLRPRWRVMATIIAIGCVLLFFVHPMYGRHTGPTFYLGISAFAAVTLLSGLAVLRQAWKARVREEELLVLAPSWPIEAQVKRLFMELMLQSQVGTWITWALITLPAYFFGWVTEGEVALSVLLLCAAGCGGCGSFLVALSRRQLKEWSIVTIALLLCCAGGVVLYEFGTPITGFPRLVGTAMIVGPLILGILWFWRRPLQFPVQSVSKQ